MLTAAQRDQIDRAAEQLAQDLGLDGYVPGYPTWGLVAGHLLDIEIAETLTCLKCGHYGLGHVGFVAADGSHSWRGFAICPECGTNEEF